MRRKCFNCGDTTHVASEFPKKDDNPKYFKCNEIGHLSKDFSKTDKTMMHELT